MPLYQFQAYASGGFKHFDSLVEPCPVGCMIKNELACWKIKDYIDQSWVSPVASARSLDREQSWPSADKSYMREPGESSRLPNQAAQIADLQNNRLNN